MKISKRHYRELEDKKRFVEKLGNTFDSIRQYTSVAKIEYDYFSDGIEIQEYAVVTYYGGACAVINCQANSMSAIFRAVGKLLDGGYYDEVTKYLLKKERQEEIEVVEDGED